jgi:hypothetical protein
LRNNISRLKLFKRKKSFVVVVSVDADDMFAWFMVDLGRAYSVTTVKILETQLHYDESGATPNKRNVSSQLFIYSISFFYNYSF